MQTPDTGNYGIGSMQYAFNVTGSFIARISAAAATGDTGVFLSSGGSPSTHNGYEIVLGGPNNPRSVIRQGRLGPELASYEGNLAQRFSIVTPADHTYGVGTNQRAFTSLTEPFTLSVEGHQRGSHLLESRGLPR